MRKLDKAAVVLGLVGTYMFMGGVDQDRWAQALIGIVVLIGSEVVYKLGEKLEEKREAEEELEEKRRDPLDEVGADRGQDGVQSAKHNENPWKSTGTF